MTWPGARGPGRQSSSKAFASVLLDTNAPDALCEYQGLQMWVQSKIFFPSVFLSTAKGGKQR